MGLSDRDYAQHNQPGVHLQAPQSLTMQLVLINIGVYVAQVLLDGPERRVTSTLALYSGWFFEPWNVYRLLTYGFLHDVNSVAHIGLNMLILWMFGSEIEQRYGRREFLYFYLGAIVAAGLIWSLSELAHGTLATLVGASGGVSAVFALYALTWPNRQVLFMFFIPMPMWIAAAIAIFFDIQGALSRSGNVAFTAHLAGAVFGLYYYKFGFSPGRWIADRVNGMPKMSGPRLKVHRPDAGFTDEPAEDAVDEILRKIQREGQESLTRKERQTLERASRELQRKNRLD